MNDKQRAEFEKWAASKGMNVKRSPYAESGYSFGSTENAWSGWQAAIASVVVELPESYGIGEVYLPAMLRALDEAGIRYE